MKRSLLLLGSLVLIASYVGHAQAQYNLVGQTAGTAYVSLTPSMVLSGQANYSASGGGTSQHHLLDLDNDGRPDLQLEALGTVVPGSYGSHKTSFIVRHSDIQLYTAIESPTGPAGVGLAVGDTLQPVMHYRTTTGKLGSWSDGSSMHNGSTYYDPFNLSSIASGALGRYSGGDWLDKQEHYLGFRLRANSAAPWRFGWLLAQVTSTSNPASLTIKSYALTSQPLGTRSALAAGWQVYPTQVADQLTIEPPANVGKGQLTVLDLRGRRMVQTELTGRQQQVRLTMLATGVYVVQADTPAGRFTQRIVKQ